MSNAEALNELIAETRTLFFTLRALTSRLLADLECTAVERGVLDELSSHARTVPELASGRAVTRQAMQIAIDRMIERRWLSVQPNPRHARSSLIALTPAGTRLLAEIRKRENKLGARVQLPVSAEELRRASRTLAATTRALREIGGGER